MNKIGKLNGEAIDAKMVSGNFATDAFTTAAFSMRFVYSIHYHKIIRYITLHGLHGNNGYSPVSDLMMVPVL